MSKELEDKIEQLEERIEELEQELEETCDTDELASHEQYGYERAMLEIESKLEHAFNAGHDIIKKPMNNKLKDFLTYKMEQRL